MKRRSFLKGLVGVAAAPFVAKIAAADEPKLVIRDDCPELRRQIRAVQYGQQIRGRRAKLWFYDEVDFIEGNRWPPWS